MILSYKLMNQFLINQVSINKPDVSTFSGVLRQYDIDTYMGIKDSIASLLEEKKIQEDLAKQSAKTKKS